MLADPTSPDAVRQEVNVIPMNFRKDYRPSKQNNGEFEEFHSVDLVKKGTNGESTPWTIKTLQKDEILWPAVKPFYERWLEGQEDPVDGTPIDVLSFIPKGIHDHLRSLHIRTAEDLAAVNDADLNRIGMGARRMKEKCIAFLENKSAGASASEVAELRTENEGLRKELDELKSLVDELTEDKPKRARK